MEDILEGHLLLNPLKWTCICDPSLHYYRSIAEKAGLDKWLHMVYNFVRFL